MSIVKPFISLTLWSRPPQEQDWRLVKLHSLIFSIMQLLLASSLWFLEHRFRGLRQEKFRLCLLWVQVNQLTAVLFEELKVWLLREELNSKVFWVEQLVNSKIDSFVMNWIKLVIDISCKHIWSLLLFVVLFSEIKLVNRITVK